MTKAQLLANLDSAELTAWMQFFREEKTRREEAARRAREDRRLMGE